MPCPRSAVPQAAERHSGAADLKQGPRRTCLPPHFGAAHTLEGNDMSEKLGVMLCGHGSRNRKAVTEFANLSEHLKKRLPHYPVEFGYLEFATPIIREGLDKLRAQGASRILAVPGMLFAAGHAKNDIPSVLNAYAAQNDLRIDYGKELGIDPKMIRAAGDRIQEAIDASPNKVEKHDTLLLVVGRGASDPDANSNIAKVMRILWEGFGFGWGEVAYSGVTFPLVEPALEHVTKLGFKRIIVFPYFLFTGVLVQRIYMAVDAAAAIHPNVEFLKAPYLNDHPAVIDTFVERIEQIISGDIAMNCQMCKYRTAVLGFEAEVGAVQESHHHHVEGMSSKECIQCDAQGNCTGLCQDGPFKLVSKPHSHAHDDAHNHGHTHAVYPHADHPLGPMTLKKG